MGKLLGRWIERRHEPQRPYRPFPVAARLVLGLLVLVLVGAGLLMLPAASAAEPLNFADALFTATSALTVTGLTVRTTAADFTTTGHLIILVLIQLGGVGYMFAISLVLLLIGGHFTFQDRLTLMSSLGLNRPGAILNVLRRSFVGIIIIEAVGALLLYLHWRGSGIVDQERVLLFAVFHAVSAFCNAGFDLFAGLPDYPLGIPSDNVTLLLMGSLIFIGGLGIPVLSELLSYRRQRLSLHTWLTLRVVAFLAILGWAGLFISEAWTGGLLADAPLSAQLTRTWFQSLSARTAGFPGLADFHALAAESQLLIMALMFVGCAPASMGGGITTGTFATLMLTFWNHVRGLPGVQVHGREISEDIIRRAGVILTASLLLVIVATWLILLTNQVTFNNALFEVISAFATCGLSLGITAELNWVGRLVLIVLMFWGRLGALTVIMAIAQQRPTKKLIHYPKESVLI
jgi:trk system potassium uptake protein